MKYNLLFICFAVIFLTSCNQEKQQMKKNIAKLEAEIETKSDPNKIASLERDYIKYADTYPNDTEMSGRYLYRAGGINYRIQNFKKATDLLERSFNDFPKSAALPNVALFLGEIYDRNLRNDEKAAKYFQFYKDNFPNGDGFAKADLYFKPLKEKLSIQIAEQEKIRFNEDKSENKAASNELRRLYNLYFNKVKDDPEGVAKYTYKSAELAMQGNNANVAKMTLERILDNEDNKFMIAESQLLLANLLEDDMNQPDEAKKIAQDFIKQFPDHKQIEEAKFYLKPAREKLDIKIKSLEDEIFGEEKNVRLNRRLANQLINKYQAFGEKFPKDKKTPDYLYKAGEIARSISDFTKALDLWNTVYTKYKSYEKAPQSLFLQGFLYENDFRDLEKAKEKYELFVKKYPKHELTDDVKFSLDNLGKSPEEIIKAFEEKKK